MQFPLPIRLVFCITELDPGGAERALTQLILHLNREQWEPYVICLGPRGHFADVLESAKISVICLNARGTLSLPRVLFQLTLELRRLKPALVQTFLFHANILGRIAARLAGIPRVVSGLRVAEHRSRWYGRIDRWTNFLVTTNVCVSRGVADFSARSVGLSPKKLVVIPNSVDFERFANALPANLDEFGIPAHSRVLITIGRLEHQKGIDILLDAVSRLNPLPDDVHFLIVGDGPDEQALRSQVLEKKISHCVHFAKRRSDIPELLTASFALILPSRWEGMPNVVLEAMAAGRPVIAARVEGVAELVSDGVTGLTVAAERPAELASAIRSLLSEGGFSIAAGSKSQEIVKKDFAPRSVAESYTNIYRQILDSV